MQEITTGAPNLILCGPYRESLQEVYKACAHLQYDHPLISEVCRAYRLDRCVFEMKDVCAYPRPIDAVVTNLKLGDLDRFTGFEITRFPNLQNLECQGFHIDERCITDLRDLENLQSIQVHGMCKDYWYFKDALGHEYSRKFTLPVIPPSLGCNPGMLW